MGCGERLAIFNWVQMQLAAWGFVFDRGKLVDAILGLGVGSKKQLAAKWLVMGMISYNIWGKGNLRRFRRQLRENQWLMADKARRIYEEWIYRIGC